MRRRAPATGRRDDPAARLDPHADRDAIHEIVGVQLQTTAFPAKLRVGEILEMYRSFYRLPADVSELVEALGLAGSSGTTTGRCPAGSGSGCRSRWP